MHAFSADSVVTRMKGSQLTLNHLYQNGFDQPILVEDKEGLDIRVPSEYFTVQDVEALVGEFLYSNSQKDSKEKVNFPS